MHSFSYGFLFSNQNGLLWFTGCMPVLFLEELRYNRPTVRTPSSFKCLLRSELEVFGAASSPGAGLSGLKNHRVSVLEITFLLGACSDCAGLPGLCSHHSCSHCYFKTMSTNTHRWQMEASFSPAVFQVLTEPMEWCSGGRRLGESERLNYKNKL